MLDLGQKMIQLIHYKFGKDNYLLEFLMKDVGSIPNLFLKTLVKYVGILKPKSHTISAIVLFFS